MKKIYEIVDCNYDIDILGITDDSRSVEEGFLFVATKGFNVDHYDYIEDAIRRGCSFVICDRDIPYDIPYIKVDNINDYFIDCCLKFYDINLDEFNFIGITGTDGKTTTATIVKEIIGDIAYIGTNGLSVVDKIFSTNNTTPCISELYKDLNIVKNNNCKDIVMEVSSEALLHERVKNFKYKIVGFTNITGDHLNVHGSFDKYVKSKLKLLDLVEDDGIVIINGDDINLQKIDCRNMLTFGFSKSNDYIIRHVNYLSNFTEITVKNKSDEYIIKSPLIGKYNVYNVVMAFIICLSFGIEKNEVIEKISKLHPIKGRGEKLDFGQSYEIVLDYAHTINGITNILNTFQGYKRIITVTGSAGGREMGKRSTIGKIVMDKSNISIFTMDDPRYEDVDEIINQMVGDREDYIRIKDRKDAINYALDIARSGDVVLILGKGRDNYMAIEDKKIEYNDYDVIKNYFFK